MRSKGSLQQITRINTDKQREFDELKLCCFSSKLLLTEQKFLENYQKI